MPAFDASLPTLALIALAAYLLGSVPFGLVIARVMGLGDLRSIGSGNIGATNVLRTGNRMAALLTLLLDGGKGLVAVLIARVISGQDWAQIAALASFVGHVYPVFAGFKGGKGVATQLGVLLALSWPVGLASCATWLATAAAFRISSLSAMVAALLAPLWCLALGAPQLLALTAALAALVFWRHRQNVARILAGTEPRFGRGRNIERD